MSPTTTTGKTRASKGKAADAAGGAAGEAAVRTLTGTVVSTKMQKTIAVVVERLVKHPQYGKYVRRTTRLLAHDEANTSREGDLVTITECRPYSKRKAWRLVEVLRRSETAAKVAV